MKRNEHKRFTGTNCFTDFKHHAKSWHNSKRLRSRMIRRRLKYKAESEVDFPQSKDIEPTVKGFADTMEDIPMEYFESGGC